MNEILWSPRAINDYLSILSYLQEKWGQKVTQAFTDRVNEVIKMIQQNPAQFQASNKQTGVRRCVLRKQVSLYFRINHNKIELITFFDNRRNPEKR